MQKLSVGIALGVLALGIGLSAFSPKSAIPSIDTKPMPFNLTAASSLEDLEASVHQQVNQYRTSRKLPPLTLDAGISDRARIHSQNMANGKVAFGHDGFQQRVVAIAIPYRNAAENVAYNFGHSDPGKQAVDGWIQSSGHRQNMEGQFDLTGIGIARNAKGEVYFTQIFIRRR